MSRSNSPEEIKISLYISNRNCSEFETVLKDMDSEIGISQRNGCEFHYINFRSIKKPENKNSESNGCTWYELTVSRPFLFFAIGARFGSVCYFTM